MNANLTGADLRGEFYHSRGLDRIVQNGGTIFTRNTIGPDGEVIGGLDLANGDRLVVRNYHGDPRHPDDDPGPLPIYTRHMTMGEGGVLQLQFDAGSWDSQIRFAPGIPVQLGGTLELTFTDDTELAIQSGRTIKAFDWTRVTPQGQFTVQGQPGTAWDTRKLYTTGEVTLLGISSDLNADKDVDSEDLLDFLANWTGSEYPAADKTWQTGDSDNDGDVDSADMLVFLSQWTGPADTQWNSSAAVATQRMNLVPEIAACQLALLGLAGVGAHVRRRTAVACRL